MVHVKVM